jgi:hypothetical protein
MQNDMKNPRVRFRLFFVIFSAISLFVLGGCDPFTNDGITDPANVTAKGYFYVTESESNLLLMLNYDGAELKRWSLDKLASDKSVQGVTFDGKYLWLSFSGNEDNIVKVNAESDTLVALKSIDAPPTKWGTIRGIAHDGTYMWALNSGSSLDTHPFAPTLYKLDATSGAIIQTITLSTPEPRGLCYANPSLDVYGRGPKKGIYYTDVTKDKVYCYNLEKFVIDTVFSTPVPPRGADYNYATGLSYDGGYFYEINSSNSADHLYKLDYKGEVSSKYDLPYTHPQSVVWANYDVRGGGPPEVSLIAPAKGVVGTGMAVEITGSGFKSGFTADFGANITIDTSILVSPNQIHLYLRIDASATLGLRDVTVKNANGLSGVLTDGFKILAVAEEDYIYMGESVLSRIYQIRLSDSTIVKYWSIKSVASVSSLQGVSYDGTNIWLSNSGTDRHIYKLNLPTGTDTVATIETGTTPIPVTTTGTLRSAAFANGYLWQVISETSPTLGKIIRIDVSTGTTLDTIICPGSNPRGITWLNGVLYVDDTDLDKIYQYSLTSKTWTEIGATPSAGGSKFATGLTNDGTNFWIANSSGTDDHLFKVNTTGQVLYVLNLPGLLSYDLGITGIAFVTK